MKRMNDTPNNDDSINNWLGFSLSSKNMGNNNNKMGDEVVPSYDGSMEYDIGFGEDQNNNNNGSINGGGIGFMMMHQPHHSSFSLLPLKSDGSLCLMEPPQGIVPSSSPKLEDFLSGANMYNYQHAQQEHSHYYSPLSCHDIYQTVPHMVPHHHNNGGELQTLSLSMSPGSQSSSCTHVVAANNNDQIQFFSNQGGVGDQNQNLGDVGVIETKKKRGCGGGQKQKQPVHRKSIDTFGQRTSQFRGVTRHRWTGRYEAHLWDNSCKNEGQTRKGRQVYLGGYDLEDKAARAYDLAALKYWGPTTHINYPVENYQTELEEMKNMTRQEFVAHLRRKSSGFSRGASMYRGVTRHHQHGRWQARIGRVAGNKDLYLGTFSTQEEAAEAYDVAAIKFRGTSAVTNFDISRYDVEKIMASNTLLAGELARRVKEKVLNIEAIDYHPTSAQSIEKIAHHEIDNGNEENWKMALYNPPKEQHEIGNFQNSPFSTGLIDLIGAGSGEDELVAKYGASAHFSNTSSLVTSLSSSREATPDRVGSSVPFYVPPVHASVAAPISMAHFPMFAAWNE